MNHHRTQNSKHKSYFSPEMTTLAEFLERTKDYHILVVGDIMLDRYIWGRVERISPEAPVPVLLLDSAESRLGGAANVALNLKRLGARVSLMGVVGDDKDGKRILEMLDNEEIEHSRVISSSRDVTTVKTRVLGGYQHLLRIDEEKRRNSLREDAVQFRSGLDALDDKELPNAIILQDYNKGFLSAPMIRMLLNFASERKIPVSVDPKEENFFEYRGVSIFKPNLRELRARVPFSITVNLKSLEAAATYLSEDIKCGMAAITLSEHGIYLSDGNTSGVYPTKARHVVDVCGAGDAVISVLTLASLMNASLEQMALLANAAGGVVCGEVGVCPVDIAALRTELNI